jgi:hypothetical protein
MDKLDLSITGVAKKIVSLFTIFGFYPMTIVDKKSVTKPIDVFLFIMNLSIGAYICFFSISNRDVFATSTSYIANTGSFLAFIAAIVIAMISMICALYYRHQTWAMVLKMEAVEEKVCEG